MTPVELAQLLGYSGDGPADDGAQTPGDPVASEFADSSIARDQAAADQPAYNPGQWNSAIEQAPVSAPQAVTAQATRSKEGGSAGLSQSASARGYDPRVADMLKAGPMSDLDRAIAKDRAVSDARYAPYQVAEAGAAHEQIAAAKDKATIEAEKATAMAHGDADIAKELRRQADEDQMANAKGQALAEQRKADYTAALQAIPMVNPQQIWEEAGTVGSYGMAMAAFVHDFLGAKGIKTSAMDTINGAIKRNMDAQIQNIATKRNVASGFKDLWDMTMKESDTQAEARAKMHGYMLASVKSGIQAEMGKYDSRLADNTYLQAMGKIDEELTKSQMTVAQHADEAGNQRAKQEIEKNGQMLQASIAARSNATSIKVAQIHEEGEMARAAAKAKSEKQTGMDAQIIDPETNKGKWRFKPWVSETQRSKVSDLVAKFEPANIIMNRLRELERKMKPQLDPVTGTRFSGEDQSEYDGLRTELAHSLVAARGERPTDKDVDEQLKLLPTNTTLRVGGIKRILAVEQINLNNSMQSHIRQFAEDVPPAEQQDGVKGQLNEGSYTDANIVHKGQDEHADTIVDLHVKNLGHGDKYGVDTTDFGSTGDQAIPNTWKKFDKESGGDFWERNKHEALKGRGDIRDKLEATQKDAPPLAYTELYHLAELGWAGHPEATKALHAVAAKPPSADEDYDHDLQDMAKFLENLKPNAR